MLTAGRFHRMIKIAGSNIDNPDATKKAILAFIDHKILASNSTPASRAVGVSAVFFQEPKVSSHPQFFSRSNGMEVSDEYLTDEAMAATYAHNNRIR